MPTPSTVLEPDTVYCAVSDVERVLRGTTITPDSDPPTSEVESLIRDATDYLDTQTQRAWRERRIEDLEISVEFHRQATTPRLRRRRSGGARMTHQFRGLAFLPTPSVRQIDSTQGDQVEIIMPTEATDVTDNEGRSRDGSYVIDRRNGVVKPSMFEFRATNIPSDVVMTDPRMRFTYRYGESPSTTLEGGLSVIDQPRRVKEACAKKVASEIHENDDYGMTINTGGEGRDPEQSAQSYRDDVDEFVAEYRWRDVI